LLPSSRLVGRWEFDCGIEIPSGIPVLAYDLGVSHLSFWQHMMKMVRDVIDCSGGRQMKVKVPVRLASMAAILLTLLGCSDRRPVHETDDPVTVVREAWRGFLAEDGRTCHEEVTNNSGPGSLDESLIEVQGRDRIHMVINKQGGPNPGHSEFIFIGHDKYFQFGNGPWQKFAATTYVGEIPLAILSEIVDDSGLKLVRRETVEDVPTFLYENTYHPLGVSDRTTTDDIWIGANDRRIRKAQILFSVTLPLTEPIVTRHTMTCSYGPVPGIKPPI
jgi:hypothetical protein